MAKPNKHKKQHFVPACYLKAWTDPNAPANHEPYVWVFDKDGGNPRRKAPDDLFHETYMYTINGPDGARNLTLERGLSQLEGHFARIRDTKLLNNLEIDLEEFYLLCAFAAATRARTPANREHWRGQWSRPLVMMEELQERMKTATEDEKRSMAAISMGSSKTKKEKSMGIAEVRKLVEQPLQIMLGHMISAETPLLARLDVAIWYRNEHDTGFITSDAPCVWFDPEAYRRPPLYRAPALGYETIEITLPISPTHCLFLNRKGVEGYMEVPANIVDDTNRRTRFKSNERFVVRREMTNPFWFHRGEEPPDSWDRQHGHNDDQEVEPNPD
jgi:hypothetical protein